MTTYAGLRKRATQLAAAMLTSAGLLAGADDEARAGTYPMYACDVPGVNLPSPGKGPWALYLNSEHVIANDDCNRAGRGGSYSLGINYPYGVLAQNTGGGLELAVPSSGPQSAITIDRVVDWTETQLTPGSGGQAPAFGLGLAPSISSSPGGMASGFDGTGTSGSGHDSGALPGGTTSHRLGVFCALAGGGYSNCTLPNQFLRIRGIKTTLRETVAPTATVDGGSLTLSGARTGTKTVSFSAADAESGVQKVEVLLDGTVVATEDDGRNLSLPVASQTGDCTYSALRACPATTSGTLAVNTASVPDGAYALEVRATDAAGNTRTATHGSPVVIDNVPDTVVMPPTQNPVGGATKTTPATSAGGVTSGPDNGTGATPNAVMKATFASSRRGVITSRHGRQVLVTGVLKGPDGKPIGGAKLHVLHQDKTVGAPMVAVAEVVTDADGTFRHVTTAERSRTIRIAYRARLADTDFAETTDIALSVVASVGLRVDRTALRNGQSVRFSGSIPGAPAGSRKVVELQVKKGNGWMTFRSTRLRSGRFNERYRFTRTRGTANYTFRARVRAEAGFPFATGHSKQVRVQVRG
jgi:hypothetical protein